MAHQVLKSSSQELRKLERRLAEIEERHPLFPEARRLRATWREATGDATHAVEGLEDASRYFHGLTWAAYQRAFEG